MGRRSQGVPGSPLQFLRLPPLKEQVAGLYAKVPGKCLIGLRFVFALGGSRLKSYVEIFVDGCGMIPGLAQFRLQHSVWFCDKLRESERI